MYKAIAKAIERDNIVVGLEIIMKSNRIEHIIVMYRL
jgi:hypothetical protein